jgi:hypothetical protein
MKCCEYGPWVQCYQSLFFVYYERAKYADLSFASFRAYRSGATIKYYALVKAPCLIQKH